ncbi:MAG: cysteine synthase A [Hydrogenophilaceae bacterium]|jgi:cysteine synthase A|nr:cysteine synthase A [Hydrogenophilaceae bacterium]
MRTHPSVLDAIGDTPLIRLRRASELTGCEIYGKAEFLNPGQSVKDRAALAIVKDAEAKGTLRPGGTIVEGTAGNTGIGLALIGAAKGYKVIVVMPRTQSQEKKDAVIALGAELVEVDAVKASDDNHYPKVARRIAEEKAKTEPNGAIWANQFDNIANRQGHIDTTGPEIWRDTDGKVDGFICAVGSGGTLGGVSMALKARNKDVVIGIADPGGAALYEWYKNGVLKAEGTSITEGIGQGRVTANLEGVIVDEAYRIEDEDWLPVLYDLVQHEGLCVGGSSALNVLGAMELAKTLGPGKTIVTILCDYGNRYMSRLFNPDFLRSKGLPTPPWLR